MFLVGYDREEYTQYLGYEEGGIVLMALVTDDSELELTFYTGERDYTTIQLTVPADEGVKDTIQKAYRNR